MGIVSQGVPEDADKQDAGLKGGLAGDAFVRVAVSLSGGLGGEPVGLVVGIAGVVVDGGHLPGDGRGECDVFDFGNGARQVARGDIGLPRNDLDALETGSDLSAGVAAGD